MDLMGSVPGPQKHKKRSVSFASQAEVQTLTPEGGHQVLTSAPISTPKPESQSAKPDPKPDPKPNPSQPSDQPVAAEAIPDPEAEVMVDDAEDEGISQTPPNLDMPDLGEFTSQTSSSPELPTPSTPLTLTPTSSQQTSQPSQSSTASSGPSSIGDIDLSQDWDEVKRQIHKCTEKIEVRACIQKLETWVASLGDSPFRKKVQDFFLQEAEERGELTQTAISFLSLRNKDDLWARVQAQVGWEDTHDARQPVLEQLDMSRPWAHELLGLPRGADEAVVKKRYRKLVLWAQRFDISVIQRINGAKDVLCGDSRRLYEAHLNGLVAPRGEDLGDDPTLWPREHVWWPSMADVESPEPMQAANPGTTALHGPISPEPTSTSSPPHPVYIDADDTPSPAEGRASGVDGIRVLGILLTNREITEQLGGDRWIGDNLIEIRVQLMNLLLHRKLGLQRRVWPVTLWRKKCLPQKENLFALDWFILVCGEQGHWWGAIFLHLLSSPEVWILDSLCPNSAQRQQRGTVLWDLLKRHWQVHNQHQPWPFSTDPNLKKFHCVHQPDGWSCAVFACCGAEWVVSLVLRGSEVDLSPLSLELSDLDLRNILRNWHRTVRLLHTDVVPDHALFPDSRTPSSVSTMPACREEQVKMAEEEGMIYHCWASVSPMHASSSPPIVAYSAKDGGAKRAGSRQRGRCGGSGRRSSGGSRRCGRSGRRSGRRSTSTSRRGSKRRRDGAGIATRTPCRFARNCTTLHCDTTLLRLTMGAYQVRAPQASGTSIVRG